VDICSTTNLFKNTQTYHLWCCIILRKLQKQFTVKKKEKTFSRRVTRNNPLGRITVMGVRSSLCQYGGKLHVLYEKAVRFFFKTFFFIFFQGVTTPPPGTGQKSALSSFVLHLSYRSAFFGRKTKGRKTKGRRK
jgi:hypothetical protein